MPHTTRKSGNDSTGSDDNSSENSKKSKHFVAARSHGHSKRNLSSSRLNKMNRMTPLHGINDSSMTSKSPKSTAALVGSSTSNSVKFLRSKSTDNVLSHHPHDAMQRRSTSQALIRSSKSQTRMSRHVHHSHMQPLMPTRSRDNSVNGKRKSVGGGNIITRSSQPVLQLDHEDSDSQESEEDHRVYQPVEEISQTTHQIAREALEAARMEAQLEAQRVQKEQQQQTQQPSYTDNIDNVANVSNMINVDNSNVVNTTTDNTDQSKPQSIIEQAHIIAKAQAESIAKLKAEAATLTNSKSKSSSSIHTQTHLKPPSLPNNQSKSDEEYEDTDADDEPAPPPSSKPIQLNKPTDSFKPSLHPTTPTPPQISTETVVAVSGNESKSSSYLTKPNQPTTPTSENTAEITRSRFLDNAGRSGESTPYPVASWVDLQKYPLDTNESSSSSNSHSSPVTTRTQQKLWLQRQFIDNPPPSTTSMLLTTDQRRDFERITKEFINVRKFQNPIAETIDRIRSLRQPTVSSVPLQNRKKRQEINPNDPYGSLSQSLPKRVTSLSATTLNENNDFPTDETNINDTWKNVTTTTAASTANVGSVAYKLTKIWNEGWRDPDEPAPPIPEPSPSIHAQAQQIQQQMVAAQRQLRPNGGIKLV